MGTSVESEARKALARLKRALEKARRELYAVEGAISRAEGDEFPAEDYGDAAAKLQGLVEFAEEEGRRLQAKVLERGGLEAGRIRRTSSLGPE